MGKIDDNDEQIEEVARILKELTRADEKKEEEPKEEILDFTELIGKDEEDMEDSSDEDEDEEDEGADYAPLAQEFHLDREESAEEIILEESEPEEEVLAKEEPLPEEEVLPKEEPLPEEEPIANVEDLSEEEEESSEEEEAHEEENPPEVEKTVGEEDLSEEEAFAKIEDLSEEDDFVEEEAGPEEDSSEEATSEEEKPAEEKPQQVVKTPVETIPVKKKAVRKTSANAPSAKKQEKIEPEPEPEPVTKGKLTGNLVRKIIFCVSLGVFAFALIGLLILLRGYYISQKEYDQINDDYVVIGTGTAPENTGTDSDLIVDVSTDEVEDTIPFLDISVDERKLKALNEDYAFYIVIPGTNIQYPVVQGDDNNHYLRYTYSNQENTAGSIQVDYRTDRDTYLQTFNTILHGHNRQDGTMFSDLANYIDESYRDENPYIYIILDGKEYVYEIFAFYDMIPVAVCYNPNTEDMTYLSFIEENNTYTGDIEVTLDDHIISLYTCNDDSSMRYLVHAVLREIYDLS